MLCGHQGAPRREPMSPVYIIYLKFHADVLYARPLRNSCRLKITCVFSVFGSSPTSVSFAVSGTLKFGNFVNVSFPVIIFLLAVR